MNAIEIRDLTKRYKGFTLDSLSLTLPEGCIMGLVGENGAGKSTTIKALLGMIRTDGGSISMLGKENAGTEAALKQEIGVVPDEIGLPDTLTPEQIGKVMRKIFPQWDDAVYSDYLTQFKLPPKKRFKTFSKGMKMKLGIAIALSHHARLLILDEPTAGLDPVVRDEILGILSEFTRDPAHSVLISSHIVSDLEKLCDYIAFIHEGRLLLCEEKDRLLEQYGALGGSEEDLAELNADAILYKTVTPYGVQAIVDRSRIPVGFETGTLTLEEIFVSMVKGA